MKITILFYVLLLYPLSSFGEKTNVLFQGVKTSKFDYYAFLETHDEFKSFIDYYLEKTPKSEDEKLVVDLFEKAKKALWSHRPKRALHFLKTLSSYSLKNDWKEVHRQIFFEAFLLLAQEAKTDKEKLKYIRKALSMGSFSPLSVLPKDTMTLFEKEKKNTFWWTPPEDFKKFELVLVNGQKQGLGGKIALPFSTFRLLFLSNQYRPIVFINDFKGLKDLFKNPLSLRGFSDEIPNPSQSDELFLYSKEKKLETFRAHFSKLKIPQNYKDTLRKPQKRKSFKNFKPFKWIFWGFVGFSGYKIMKSQNKRVYRIKPHQDF